ncbi:MAG: hypothetical protein JWN52_7552 [Actinomycetia bacterium]|nr:hypothetical protein [Actinomycetes bacterium]
MDELQLLANLLAKPDQSRDMIDHGRHQLQKAMRGPVHKRKTGWLAGGLGLTAAAVGAVVVVSSTTAPTATPNSPPAAVQQNARQILLTAATTALRTPMGSGTYWYVKNVSTKRAGGVSGQDSVETWVRRDGKSWVRQGAPASPVISNDGSHGHWADGFDVADHRLSLGQIQQLPTDPVALKAWIVEHRGRATPPGLDFVIGELVGLLSGVPAPPKVRAAAFRALASLPNVKSLGPVKGGQGLLLPDPQGKNMLVVDPATSKVRGSNFSDVIDGQRVSGSSAVVAAEWTNLLPKVAPDSGPGTQPHKAATHPR